MNRQHFVLFALLLTLTNCRKKDVNDPPPGSTTSYEMEMKTINPYAFPVNMRTYLGLKNYAKNLDPISTVRLEANSEMNVSLKNFNNSDTLYFDIFSDDYTYTNWGYFRDYDSSYFTHRTAKNVLDGGYLNFLSYAQYVGNARNAFLQNDQYSTRWLAFNRVNYQWISTWDTLNEHERYFEVIIDKDLTYTMSRKAQDGTITVARDKIKVYELYNPTINAVVLQNVPYDMHIYGTNYNPDQNKPSTDTAVLWDLQGNYWILKRQD